MHDSSQTDFDDFRVSMCEEERKHCFQAIPAFIRSFGGDGDQEAAIAALNPEKVIVAWLDCERRLNVALHWVDRFEAILAENGIELPHAFVPKKKR